MSKKSLKPVAAAIGAAFVGSMALSGNAVAESNPFGMSELNGGYMQIASNHEGKCGGSAPKATEGKCGGAGPKSMDGKCGAGKCGAEMQKPAAAEGKCGGAASKATEGKCGGSAPKAAEGKCGAGKCGGSN